VKKLLISGIALLTAVGGRAEITTGFLVGPRYDSRAFYVRTGPDSAWEKTYQGRDFKKQAQGKLFGARLDGIDASALDAAAAAGLLLVSVALQDESGANAFLPDGALDPSWAERLDAFLKQADARKIAVQLVCFHQSQDQNLDAQEAILNAASGLTDFLIDGNHRNVVLTPAAGWTQPGWDHDHFVPVRQERIISAMRDRFQARRADYALPIAVSLDVPLRPDLALLNAADILILSAGGRSLDTRRIDRPLLFVAADGAECGRYWTADGCIFPAPADFERSAPALIHARAPKGADRSK
jgi:hypothetical protein